MCKVKWEENEKIEFWNSYNSNDYHYCLFTM